jgi:hypothetical protein
MDIVLAASNGKSLGDPTAVDDDGFLADIDISSITGAKKPKGDVNKDIRHFFGLVYHVNKPCGKVDSRRICLKCPGYFSIFFLFACTHTIFVQGQKKHRRTGHDPPTPFGV